ncbi:MMS19 nucleotide excision repair protein, partial [Phytophthora palmivora]
MTREKEEIALWRTAKSCNAKKLQQLVSKESNDSIQALLDHPHPVKGTTPLMVAASKKYGVETVRSLIDLGADLDAKDSAKHKNTALHYAAYSNRIAQLEILLDAGADTFALNAKEGIVRQLIAAGADVNAEDGTKLMNTALHYAAMTNRDSLVVDALLNEGADAFALNRKGLSPLDLARQYRRGAVAAALMEHMKVHSGWLFLRGQFRWKKRWAVVVACNKQRTSRELCIFHHPRDVRPDAVLLVDEAARASPFASSDSFCWLKRENAFIFDKPVMCQRVKRQKLTRSPVCRKTMSQEDVQTRDLVFAADSLHSLECWQRVLQSSNFYDRETGAPLYDLPPFDAPHGELYYWPHELVENVRSSTLRRQEQREEDTPLFERLRRTLENSQSQPQDEEPLEDMLQGLQQSSDADRDAPLAPAIDAFVDPENDDAAQKTGLNTVVMQVHRTVTMEALIQALGAYLTSGDDKVRSRATLLLAEVLTRLPELQLTPSAVQLLLTFFADRLADFPSASACLRALLALETHHAAQVSSPRTTVALILKLGSTLHIPQLGQAMRKMCFDLMQLALAQSTVVELLLDSVPANKDAQDASVDDAEQSEDLGRQFAQTFLSAMEGEKDPRNLLLCMQVARTLLSKLEAVFSRSDALLQQYFDIVSCYFPIIFTPPPNDPYGITSEGLILSLRHAFAASDLLAPLVLPFLLKKLASTVVEAKLDALQTLVFCGERYSVNALLLQMHAVATALYDEVLDGEKQEVIAEARLAISRFSGVVARARAQDTPGAAYAWSKFVVEMTARAAGELRENAADSMVSVSAGQVLAALGHDSSMSFAHVLKIAVPLLVEQLDNESSGSD